VTLEMGEQPDSTGGGPSREGPDLDRTEPYVPSGRVQLGEYIIEERIGSGGMGQVYRARQPSLDRMVALKVLPRSTAQSAEHVERFYREARNAAKLIHPNIVQIYTVGEDKGVPYFAMEYVIGEDLDRRLQRGEKFSIQETLGIVTSVAMALACAEEHGIVHRDIKPGNIMIDSHGVVKVTDFGLAKAVKVLDTEITQAGFIVGTPTYMAPEQAEGREVDVRTDIYSLGVVFYELLCGRPPFKSDDPATMIYMHVHKAPDPPRTLQPEIPEEVERVCLKCLAKKPEERFQSSAELLAELVRLRDTVKIPDEGGTIVFDRRMADMLVSSHLTRAPGQAPGEKTERAQGPEKPEKTTERTVSIKAKAAVGPLDWLSLHWPIVAGAGSAAVAVLVVTLVLLLSGRGADEPEPAAGPAGVEAGAPSAQGSGPPQAEPAPERRIPDRPVLPLSRLRGFLPEGTEIEVQIGANPPYRVRSLDDQAVEPGRVRVTARRPHYKDATAEFEVGVGTCVPELSSELFRLEPDESLASLIEKIRTHIRDEDFAVAAQSLDALRLLDPGSRLLPELERALAESRASWNRRWVEAFQKAERALAEGRSEEADSILASIPALHEHYEAARRLREDIAAAKMKLLEGRARVEGLLREGKFREARAACEGLVNVLRLPSDAISDLTDQLARAEDLEKEAELAERSGSVESARASLISLAKIAPSSTAISARIARLDEAIERLDRARKIVAVIEERLAEKDFARATAELAALRQLEPQSERVRELETRVKTRAAEHEIGTLLGFLDKGLLTLDAALVATLVDPESKEFLSSCRDAVQGLQSQGVRFYRSKFKLKGLELREDGATADVSWEYAVDIPSAKGKVSASRDMRLSFRRGQAGLRLAAVTGSSRETASLDGGGGQDARVRGQVVAADRDVVTIDRGSSAGVRLGMVFGIYRDARVARLPLVDAVVVIEEEKIGECRVVEVRPNECLASFVAGALSSRPVAGMLAVEAPLSALAGAPPAIIALKADRVSARMGEAIGLEAVSRNPDGLPAFYLWAADGGRVSPARSVGPKASWLAPARAGEYRVRVTAVSPLGSTSREIVLRSTGPSTPARLVPLGELHMAASFDSAADLAFNEAGGAYVLDGRSRLVSLDSEFKSVSASGPYRGQARRLACTRSHVYVLDGSSCAVQRYALAPGKDPFAAPPGTSYGGAGVGNGKLRRPVAFTLTPDGCVAILDAGTSTVQVFGPEGRFLTSMGLAGRGPGEMTNPVAIVSDSRGGLYVLDSGRRQVLAFRGGRFDGEFPAGPDDSELADLAYDAIGDRLLVLDKKRSEVAAYSTGGSKFPVSIIPARLAPKPGERSQEPSLGELSAPSRIVCDGMARLYVIGGDRNQTVDRFCLPLPEQSRGDTGSAPGRFAGQMTSVVPTGFSRIAAAPDGTLHLLDPSAGLLWQMQGVWKTAALGARSGPAPSWSGATAVACDGAGDFYVLEPAMCWVHRFSPAGKRISHFGKKGSADDPFGLPDAVDIAATTAFRAPSAGPQGELVAVLLRDRQFGIHLFTPEGEALPPFPSRTESARGGTQIALGADGAVYVACQGGIIESFTRAGELKGRIDTGVAEPSALAASADGLIYVLDARRRAIVGVSPRDGKAILKAELPRGLRSPSDLACDGFGIVHVVDARARTVFSFGAAASQEQ